MHLLKRIQKDKQFEKTFDPIRLRMYLILSSHQDAGFSAAVRVYKK
jgi:hypothetical protein